MLRKPREPGRRLRLVIDRGVDPPAGLGERDGDDVRHGIYRRCGQPGDIGGDEPAHRLGGLQLHPRRLGRVLPSAEPTADVRKASCHPEAVPGSLPFPADGLRRCREGGDTPGGSSHRFRPAVGIQLPPVAALAWREPGRANSPPPPASAAVKISNLSNPNSAASTKAVTSVIA